MLKIRLMGTTEECNVAANTLGKIFDIERLSKEYPCRGSDDIRLYLDAKSNSYF